MYQVVEIKGDMEPWWFLEGWQEDIISTKEFENFYDALKYYKKLWFAMIGRKFLRKNTVRDMKSKMTFQIMPIVE